MHHLYGALFFCKGADSAAYHEQMGSKPSPRESLDRGLFIAHIESCQLTFKLGVE